MTHYTNMKTSSLILIVCFMMGVLMSFSGIQVAVAGGEPTKTPTPTPTTTPLPTPSPPPTVTPTPPPTLTPTPTPVPCHYGEHEVISLGNNCDQLSPCSDNNPLNCQSLLCFACGGPCHDVLVEVEGPACIGEAGTGSGMGSIETCVCNVTWDNSEWVWVPVCDYDNIVPVTVICPPY